MCFQLSVSESKSSPCYNMLKNGQKCENSLLLILSRSQRAQAELSNVSLNHSGFFLSMNPPEIAGCTGMVCYLFNCCLPFNLIEGCSSLSKVLLELVYSIMPLNEVVHGTSWARLLHCSRPEESTEVIRSADMFKDGIL